MVKITSSSNKTYKYFKSLLTKKARYEYGEFVVEGIKSVRDALISGKEIAAVIVSDEFTEEFDYGGNDVYEIPAPLFERLCDTKTPQGIAAVIKMYGTADFMPDTNGAYVYCDGVSDPGNLGTIIRTADAAGFSGVILSDTCADIYSPKTVRASMGSFFNIDLISGKTAADLVKYKSMGFNLLGGALTDNTIDYRAADYSKPTIIIVGNEANGISDDVLKICTPVKIPIYGRAESLNAAVAAGILMYEWARNNRA